MDEALDVPVTSVENFVIPIEIQVCLWESVLYFQTESSNLTMSGPVTATSAKGCCVAVLPKEIKAAGTF
jgi:hypothetical protein